MIETLFLYFFKLVSVEHAHLQQTCLGAHLCKRNSYNYQRMKLSHGGPPLQFAVILWTYMLQVMEAQYFAQIDYFSGKTPTN